MENIGRQMQQDRQDGNYTYKEYDERTAQLAAMGASNAIPPLAVSPCIKVIATGEVHEWSSFFANRPDLCVNCDEHGDTDPAKWRGHTPGGVNMEARPDIYADYVEEKEAEKKKTLSNAHTPELKTIASPVTPAVHNFMFFPEQFTAGPTPGAVPQVGQASKILGIPDNFTQDYTDPVNTKAALPLPATSSYINKEVSSVVQEVFARQNESY